MSDEEREQLREGLRKDIEGIRAYADKTGDVHGWRKAIVELQTCLAMMGGEMGDELTKDMLVAGLREFAKQKANCGSCIFFRCEPIEDVPSNGGHCKRFPPVPHSDYMFGQFPVLMPQDWCGEHSPAADMDNE